MTKQPTYKTVAELRAAIDEAKPRALAKFASDWGTSDVNKVTDALRATIADSANPADWTKRARATLDEALDANATRQRQKAYDLAYARGQVAQEKSLPITANPYHKRAQRPAWRAWREGWEEREHEKAKPYRDAEATISTEERKHLIDQYISKPSHEGVVFNNQGRPVRVTVPLKENE